MVVEYEFGRCKEHIKEPRVPKNFGKLIFLWQKRQTKYVIASRMPHNSRGI